MPASECSDFDIRVKMKFQSYIRNRHEEAAEKQSIHKVQLETT